MKAAVSDAVTLEATDGELFVLVAGERHPVDALAVARFLARAFKPGDVGRMLGSSASSATVGDVVSGVRRVVDLFNARAGR